MEARLFRAALALGLVALGSGASYRTPNFLVRTGDAQFAQQMGQAAEKHRRDLAVSWLGKALPDWSQPCVMTVHAAPNLAAGGATTFLFDRGEVYGWRMTIQGSRERLLDSVLPHEVLHTIFASHFRRPLPRWADEGACTTVEHASELNKQRHSLVQYLQTRRGIAFNQLFAMTEYPPDVGPLYAQAYSLADYLIQQGGRRKYVDYVGDGLSGGDWSGATQRHYGFANLGELQQTWVGWVAQGSPRLKPREPAPGGESPGVLLADAGRLVRPQPDLIYRASSPVPPAAAVAAARASDWQSIYHRAEESPAAVASSAPQGAAASAGHDPLTSGWRASAAGLVALPANPPESFNTQAARPQPFQGPGQVVRQ